MTDKKPDTPHGGFSPKPKTPAESHSGQGVDTVDLHKDKKKPTNPEIPGGFGDENDKDRARGSTNPEAPADPDRVKDRGRGAIPTPFSPD